MVFSSIYFQLLGAVPLDPAGGLLSPAPRFYPLRNKFQATPLVVTHYQTFPQMGNKFRSYASPHYARQQYDVRHTDTIRVRNAYCITYAKKTHGYASYLNLYARGQNRKLT